ncbi:MAG: TIGR00730 family Rossman fold protein [Candidatus Scalindua sp.]|nr:TIGR00730 family Rossman fold protein [Candidatus Scalindua sp.]
MEKRKMGKCDGVRDNFFRTIADLAELCSTHENADLLKEMVTTILKLGRENSDRGDLKLINKALKELRYAAKTFVPYRNTRKVVFFGSARTRNDSAEYKMAEKLSALMVNHGFKVITGGGPGIMEAGNKGAKRENSFSLNIRLPFEQRHNPYIEGDKKAITFKYFFNRKLFFLKESDATVLFPGGFGTMDECFENLTLIQTGKSKPLPLILIEPPESNYWGKWMTFLRETLAKGGFISPEDLNLFFHTHDVEEALDEILKFFRVYHSMRYFEEKTVINLNRLLKSEDIQLLNEKYKSILRSGTIRLSPPHSTGEEGVGDSTMPRLVMDFNRRDFGKFHEMAKFLNTLVA